MFHIKSHCQKKKSLSSPSSSKFSPISKFIWIFSYVYFCALNISGKFYETHKVCDQIYFFLTFAQMFQHHLMKDYLFSIGLPLLLSQRSVYYMCVGLFLALFSVPFICSWFVCFFFFPIADCIHHCSLKSGSVNPPALNFLNIMMAIMPFCFWYKLLNKCIDIQKLTSSDLD